jgi:hypothetical protein
LFLGKKMSDGKIEYIFAKCGCRLPGGMCDSDWLVLNAELIFDNLPVKCPVCAKEVAPGYSDRSWQDKLELGIEYVHTPPLGEEGSVLPCHNFFFQFALRIVFLVELMKPSLRKFNILSLRNALEYFGGMHNFLCGLYTVLDKDHCLFPTHQRMCDKQIQSMWNKSGFHIVQESFYMLCYIFKYNVEYPEECQRETIRVLLGFKHHACWRRLIEMGALKGANPPLTTAGGVKSSVGGGCGGGDGHIAKRRRKSQIQDLLDGHAFNCACEGCVAQRSLKGGEGEI